MKTFLAWLFLFGVLFFFTPPTGFRTLIALLLCIAGTMTAYYRMSALKTFRAALGAWQKTNNERLWHAEKVAHVEVEAAKLKLERIHLQTQSDVRALVIGTFLRRGDVDNVLHMLATDYNAACLKQRDFLEALRIGGPHRSASVESLGELEAKFELLKRDNELFKSTVDAAKARFWKAHDLVGDAIREGLLDVSFAVREGNSFTKYLPREQGELQTLDEARREQQPRAVVTRPTTYEVEHEPGYPKEGHVR